MRWSAAKGLGRITERVPRAMGDDVVEAVLQTLHTHAANARAWHGGCLAVAELARRGVLLPARVHDVLPLLYQALQFDIKQGSATVGANVRDAACYVLWCTLQTRGCGLRKGLKA